MARKRKGKGGSWANGNAPAQGSASTGKFSQAATGHGFHVQVATDSVGIARSVKPGVWHPRAVKP